MMKRILLGVTFIGVMAIGILALREHFGTHPETWKAYPTDRDALVKQFFTLIHEDTDPALDKAYALISQRMKDPNADDEIGKYRQTFHDLARYLNGEFGSTWSETLSIEHDDGNANGPLRTIVAVQTEKFHIPLDLEGPDGQTPEQLAAASAADRHYGVHAIEEFSVQGAGKSSKQAVISGVINLYGANKSSEQLSGIINTTGSPPNESVIDAKRRLLPIVRNPNATGLKRALHQLWPVRKDPTVKARLESIMGDERYEPTMQQVAKRVHDGSEAEEELIADGVNL